MAQTLVLRIVCGSWLKVLVVVVLSFVFLFVFTVFVFTLCCWTVAAPVKLLFEQCCVLRSPCCTCVSCVTDSVIMCLHVFLVRCFTVLLLLARCLIQQMEHGGGQGGTTQVVGLLHAAPVEQASAIIKPLSFYRGFGSPSLQPPPRCPPPAGR